MRAHNGLFVGQCSVELVYYLPHALKPGQRMRAERQVAFAGGTATNAAIAFSAFDNVSSLVTGLGEHPLSEVARADIMDRAVALIDLDSLPHRPPSVGVVLVDLESHVYSVAYATTYARKLRSLDLGEAIFHDVEVVLLDGAYMPQALEAASMARERGIPVVLDAGVWREGMQPLLPLVDYLIASRAFRLPKCNNVGEMFAALHSFGVGHIAVTRGEKPVLAYEDGVISEIPIARVRVLDSLGAGDILHGAFCHYILERDFKNALEMASRAATLSCTALGPRPWIEQIKSP